MINLMVFLLNPNITQSRVLANPLESYRTLLNTTKWFMKLTHFRIQWEIDCELIANQLRVNPVGLMKTIKLLMKCIHSQIHYEFL